MDAPYSEGQRLARVSNGLVHLHTRYYGKGPTAAKTYLVQDTVICMLRECFTTVERTLLDDGRAEAVHQMRRSFQASMHDQFEQVVEEALHRRVIGHMSQIHVDPDVAMELFMLEPSPEPFPHPIVG
jgi:uncharacterized protein YbcI